jgi:hypothetical protein
VCPVLQSVTMLFLARILHGPLQYPS